MTHLRKSKLEEAKQLLNSEQASILNAVTAEELNKLKQHGFIIEDYLNGVYNVVTTDNKQDASAVKAALNKLDEAVKQSGMTERLTIHMQKHE
jgi:hypothetical protein